MTNIEKWLIQKGFELKEKEVKYYPIHNETVLKYAGCFFGNNVFEAKVYIYDPLGSNMNCCEINPTHALFINRFQTNNKDKPDIYASRNPEFCEEKAKQALFLLKLWAAEMDSVENPFDEVKEEENEINPGGKVN